MGLAKDYLLGEFQKLTLPHTMLGRRPLPGLPSFLASCGLTRQERRR